MWQSIQRNWKTNLVALIAFVYTVPQAVTCIQEWVNHQPCDYRSTVFGLLLAVGAAAAKDSTNHSTQEETQIASIAKQVNNQQSGQIGQVGANLAAKQPEQVEWHPTFNNKGEIK